ncbi:c-type cytochrome [Heliophilum fasciatum]|uniref:Cytochrome c oxidase cbb3-type subunit 3 n=1 Tax=Heliophilum fasciatum TaxID=35700 RepID=A0A4R2RVJ4_9FIRM|nr:c-type cytochrome [Heliophilum fasciatum]MCW2277044.1 cytochrome c oxidase cbb3-type subunit 3 [Heliophilum fasciatum]TCP68430.1 cytochrome c oxidase cbb3-type subunit 3 [Heliophilum fasciatum]
MDIRKITMFGGTALLVVGLLLAPSWQASGKLRQGHEMYKTHCASCHGDDGKGVKGVKAATLNNEGFLKIASDEYLTASIRNGRPAGAMPAFDKKTIPDEQAKYIANYIRSWRPDITPLPLTNDPVVGDAAKGEAQYKLLCAACHGQNAEGGIGTALNDAGFHASASDQFIMKSITMGRPGTAMIAYPDSPDINNIVAYLRTKAAAPAEAKEDAKATEAKK